MNQAEASESSSEPVENEIELVNLKNEDQQLNQLLIINTIYYIVVFVLIGLPIWIFTTSTYRASLPFDSIDQLAKSLNRIEYKINIEIINFNDELTADILNKAISDLNIRLDKDGKNGIELQFEIKNRVATGEEKKLALTHKIELLDQVVCSDGLNKLHMIILDDDSAKKIVSEDQYLFLNCLYLNKNLAKDTERLSKIVLGEFLHIEKINEEYRLKMDVERRLPSKKDIRVVNFDNEYEVTFSWLNERPEVYSKWNVDECVEKYFSKISDKLSDFIKISIKAQTLLYSDFGSYTLSYSKLENESFYYLRQSDLSIMTNFIESRLGAKISDSSALEFVTYLPNKEPLYIAKNLQNVKDSRSVSFMVPRWGGIYVYNPKDENQSDDLIRVEKAMKTFLTQFINLIGIDLHKSSKVVPRSGIYSSEIFGYLLTKTLENQLNSINTLNSLSLLLTRIKSMVIEDDIAEQIKTSVESIEQSLSLAKDGKIKEAFFKSKIGFLSSEKAFFDKSLLEKLYFPEDQRFAIYIPLFIPVGIPLLLSMKSVIGWYKKQKIKTD
ncbi:GPI transamidase component PIG-S-like [Brachionus plicatilis]|uniref:GPI transamidase component PIG-S-like n=1 Tax=Brachionus plicatilis TaxID=10195 RepID=A0A3M7QYW4_BRAPC|nr:GPI transamidase component PIG-S-like [Brachionus plicatilis]